MKNLKNEAIRRLTALKILDDGPGSCVAGFRKNGTVWKSEFHGILYWLDEEEQAALERFKNTYEEFNILPYHCYRAHTEFGEILYILFVADDEDFSVFDAELEQGIIYTYACNLSNPEFSEFGSCYIKSMFGGVELSWQQSYKPN